MTAAKRTAKPTPAEREAAEFIVSQEALLASIMRDVAGVEMTMKFPSRGPRVRLMGALRRPADADLVRAMISAEMHKRGQELGDRIFAEWQRRTGQL